VRIDPATGALESSRWRLEPREPQSSFAQWASAAGFQGRYHTAFDDWFVNVFFDVGGALQRVSLSTRRDLPYEKRVKALERWMDQQSWPDAVDVGVHWDKFFSDSHVSVAYKAPASDGPPPEPGDLALLARAARLDLYPPSPEYLAFERLWRQPPSEYEAAEVVRTGTAAGRCYAAYLAPAAWAALVDDTSPLSVDGALTTVAAYARVRVA